ncbi:MAG TPA: aldo/keto reductase [Terriglobales bacterium]|nr:aldo/keto reductase [Terriglobales bacterium]
MDHRSLGKNDATLPAIGLGTWQYNGGIKPLQTGIALGACFMDTAESYGTEEVVGRALQGIRKSIFLATKVSPRHFRRADVIAAADASLKRLNTDYVDLYQLHWPNYTVPIEETMGAMEELVDSGKVRFIGVSNFFVRDLERARKAMGKRKIVSNQVRYNLIDRTVEYDLLEYCRQHDITVIAHSPLATGLESIEAKDPERVINKIAKNRGKTAAQIALNWCISKNGIVTIPKANSVEHVRENCAASDFRLSPEELRLLNEKVEYDRRGSSEIFLRRIVRQGLQYLGKNQ